MLTEINIPDIPYVGSISDWMDNNRGKAGVIMLLLLFTSFYAGTQIPNSPLYSGGWEIGNSIYVVRHNGLDYGVSTGVYPWLVEYWGSKSVRYDTDASLTNELGQSYVDWDWDVIGCADTQVDITNPAHLKFDVKTQSWVPALDTEVFYQYTKTVTYTNNEGDEITKVFFYDHHVYSFWVTVISDPDIHHVYTFGVDTVGYSTGECKGLAGCVSSIAPRIYFYTKGWEIGPDTFVMTNDDGTQSTYTADKTTFWSGIMSSTVIESYAGLVSKVYLEKTGDTYDDFTDAPTPASGYHASATMSGALNMYYMDNQMADDFTDEEAQANPDAVLGVPNEVQIELYGELEPGHSWPWAGIISGSAVMFQYKVRVDVMVTGGYVLASGQQPEDPVDPIIIDIGKDPFGALFNWFSGLFTPQNALFVVIILIIVAYVAFKIIKWMYGGK